MAHAHDEIEGHGHTGPSLRTYMTIFVILCVFTGSSFAVNSLVRAGHLSTTTGFLLILGVAVCKAFLVCAYFMHLRWDWGRLYFLIAPGLIIAPALLFALFPDIVFYWMRVYHGTF